MSTLLNKKKEILREFDGRFPTTRCVTPAYAFTSNSVTAERDDLMNFLSSSLDSYAKAILEEVSELGYGNRNNGMAIGYSHAISDLSTIINNSLEKR